MKFLASIEIKWQIRIAVKSSDEGGESLYPKKYRVKLLIEFSSIISFKLNLWIYEVKRVERVARGEKMGCYDPAFYYLRLREGELWFIDRSLSLSGFVRSFERWKFLELEFKFKYVEEYLEIFLFVS